MHLKGNYFFAEGQEIKDLMRGVVGLVVVVLVALGVVVNGQLPEIASTIYRDLLGILSCKKPSRTGQFESQR